MCETKLFFLPSFVPRSITEVLTTFRPFDPYYTSLPENDNFMPFYYENNKSMSSLILIINHRFYVFEQIFERSRLKVNMTGYCSWQKVDKEKFVPITPAVEIISTSSLTTEYIQQHKHYLQQKI